MSLVGSHIRRDLPNNEYLAATNANAPTELNPYATILDLAGIGGESLSATLAIGNTTADGQTINSLNGAVQLNLRNTVNGTFDLTNDNGVYGKSWFFGDLVTNGTLATPGTAQMGFGIAAMMAFEKEVVLTSDYNFTDQNTYVSSREFIVEMAISDITNTKHGSIGMANNHSADTGSFLGFLQPMFPAWVSSRNSTIKTGVVNTAVIGGVNIIAKTNDSAYSNCFIWNKSSEAFETKVNHTTPTADRLQTLPNASGTFALGTGTTDRTARWTSTNTLVAGIIRDNGTTASINVNPNAAQSFKVHTTGAAQTIAGFFQATTHATFNTGISAIALNGSLATGADLFAGAHSVLGGASVGGRMYSMASTVYPSGYRSIGGAFMAGVNTFQAGHAVAGFFATDKAHVNANTGIFVSSFNTGAGTATAIHIQGAATTDFGLYQVGNGVRNWFNGNLSIGSAIAPIATTALRVRSTGAQTYAIQSQNSVGAAVFLAREDGVSLFRTTNNNPIGVGAAQLMSGDFTTTTNTLQANMQFRMRHNPSIDGNGRVTLGYFRAYKEGTFDSIGLNGLTGEAYNAGTGAFTSGAIGMTGVLGQARNTASNTTITNMFGIEGNVQSQASVGNETAITNMGGIHLFYNGLSDTNVTNMYGILINPLTGLTNGSVTNSYGFRMGAVSIATNNWGLYIEGATRENYIQGNLSIGATISVNSVLEVTGDVETIGSANGVILESPDNSRYRVTMLNGGTLDVNAA